MNTSNQQEIGKETNNDILHCNEKHTGKQQLKRYITYY